MQSSLTLLALLTITISSGPPAAENASLATWPQFRGPGGLGLATDGKPLPAHLEPSKNLSWKTAIPSGASSPCIWGERVFVTGFDKQQKKLQTLCLNRQDGHILWQQPASAEKIEKVFSPNT